MSGQIESLQEIFARNSISNEELSKILGIPVASEAAGPYSNPATCHKRDLILGLSAKRSEGLTYTVVTDYSQKPYMACLIIDPNETWGASLLFRGYWGADVSRGKFPGSGSVSGGGYGIVASPNLHYFIPAGEIEEQPHGGLLGYLNEDAKAQPFATLPRTLALVAYERSLVPSWKSFAELRVVDPDTPQLSTPVPVA